MKWKAFSISLVLVLCSMALWAHQERPILIKNGTIYPVTGPAIPGGSLLIEDGKIVRIGTGIEAPDGARIIDARGNFVYPGFVAPFTAIGVTGYPGAGSDTDETGETTPQLDPYDALNPEDECIEVARMEGVTTVLTVSGSRSVMNGNSLLINLDGYLAGEMVLKRNAAQIFNMGAKNKDKFPSTLPGVVSLIRDKLNRAKSYLERKERRGKSSNNEYGENREETFRLDMELEALIPVIKGEIPVLFLTQDEVTIRNALGLIKEYELKGIIYARADILKFVDQLKAASVPVIWAGTMTIPRRWEPFDWNYRVAKELSAQGILYAIDQAGWGPGSRNVRNQPVPASMSVAHGLSEEEAIKALTINPAKILHGDDFIGSLEVGKIANVVIWEGNPLQMRSRVNTVIISGKIIPRTSTQTRLRDKYEKIVRERMETKSKPR